jgi:hypothetical protein
MSLNSLQQPNKLAVKITQRHSARQELIASCDQLFLTAAWFIYETANKQGSRILPALNPLYCLQTCGLPFMI